MEIATIANCFACTISFNPPNSMRWALFYPHLTNKKTETKDGKYFALRSQSQAGFNPGSVIANPMPSATASSTPCCYWQLTDAGQAACPPTTEEVKWNSASDSSLNSFGLIIQSQRRFALPLSGLALDKNQGSRSLFPLPLPASAALSSHREEKHSLPDLPSAFQTDN